VLAVAQLPGVQRVQAQRQLPLLLAADRPAVALLARELDDPARDLPLLASRCRCRRGRSASMSARPCWTCMAPGRAPSSPRFHSLSGL